MTVMLLLWYIIAVHTEASTTFTWLASHVPVLLWPSATQYGLARSDPHRTDTCWSSNFKERFKFTLDSQACLLFYTSDTLDLCEHQHQTFHIPETWNVKSTDLYIFWAKHKCPTTSRFIIPERAVIFGCHQDITTEWPKGITVDPVSIGERCSMKLTKVGQVPIQGNWCWSIFGFCGSDI